MITDSFVFDTRDMAKLRAINARLYDDRPFTPDQRRDLANAMNAVLNVAIELDTSASEVRYQKSNFGKVVDPLAAALATGAWSAQEYRVVVEALQTDDPAIVSRVPAAIKALDSLRGET